MIRIRPARAGEAADLSALCMRSKAHWGYDEDFLRRCEAELAITPERIARGRVLAAEDEDGRLLGLAAAEPFDADGCFDLALLFIEPKAIRRRVGKQLFAAVAAQVAREGAKRLRIEADPFAAGFYEKLGARRIGEVPSTTIAGRMLPLFEFAL
ncbi:MAG TPA: GNAT family N-acetyltransferase [Rhizomicrobium sp.]|nr:GNAT family N-acetyltransferase [Rhizomicrobium sp.]